MAQEESKKIRSEILNEAKRIVNGERNEQYGSPEDNFAVIAGMWTAYIKGACPAAEAADIAVTAADVAAMMILLKVARSCTSGEVKLDTWIDIAGYAACGGAIEGIGEGVPKEWNI